MAARGGGVTVFLDAFGSGNYTPNFKEFEVRIDGGEWEAREASFFWQLHPGKNVLRARVTNRFGVPGPISSYSIYVPYI